MRTLKVMGCSLLAGACLASFATGAIAAADDRAQAQIRKRMFDATAAGKPYPPRPRRSREPSRSRRYGVTTCWCPSLFVKVNDVVVPLARI
jgi:hypothetical protein